MWLIFVIIIILALLVTAGYRGAFEDDGELLDEEQEAQDLMDVLYLDEEEEIF